MALLFLTPSLLLPPPPHMSATGSRLCWRCALPISSTFQRSKPLRSRCRCCCYYCKSITWKRDVLMVSACSSLTLITPARHFPGSTTLRILDSSSALSHDFGKILALDEFFRGSSQTPLANHHGLQETIIYFLKESNFKEADEAEEERMCQPQHGLQLYFMSTFQLPYCGGSETSPFRDRGLITHLKDASSIPQVLLEDSNGGAKVKVIAGKYGGLASSSPHQDHFLMLDIQMRSGTQTNFSLASNHINLIYVLEGVGIFHAPHLMPNGRPSYQNEGNGLVIKSVRFVNDVTQNSLQVSTHPWSYLRFILVGATPLHDD